MSNPITNGMFPVYVYEEGMELPSEGTYFVIAGNGNWMHKDVGFIKGLIPVEKVSVLDDFNGVNHLKCDLPKIPARHIWRIKEFFRRVVAKFHSEAEVNLYYSKEKNDFKIHIPEQSVSHGGVRYQRVALSHHEEMSDYLRIGTIHSHCDFGAFHSGTDVDDEGDFDGIHITFGNNDRDEFTISASVVMNGYRSKIDPLLVIEGVDGAGESFKLKDLDENTISEWSSDLDGWMKMVKGHYYDSLGRFEVGDVVVFDCDVNGNVLQSTLGNGPFRVKAVSADNKITIDGKNGEAEIADVLFKKETKLS